VEVAHTRLTASSRDHAMVLPFPTHVCLTLAHKISSTERICSFGHELFWRDEIGRGGLQSVALGACGEVFG